MTTAELAQVLESWPQLGTGNDGPRIRAGSGSLIIAYPMPSEEIAIVEFPACIQLVYGHPNDEVIQGHYLYGKGLQLYSVHIVRGSSKIAALERSNSVHPNHDPARYVQNKEHYVFTFQDGTLECVVLSGDRFAPKVRVVPSWLEATAAMAQSAA